MAPDSWGFLIGLAAVLTIVAFAFDAAYRSFQRWVWPTPTTPRQVTPDTACPTGPGAPSPSSGPVGPCCANWYTARILQQRGGRLVCPTHYAESPHLG